MLNFSVVQLWNRLLCSLKFVQLLCSKVHVQMDFVQATWKGFKFQSSFGENACGSELHCGITRHGLSVQRQQRLPSRDVSLSGRDRERRWRRRRRPRPTITGMKSTRNHRWTWEGWRSGWWFMHEAFLFRFNPFKIIGFSHLCTVGQMLCWLLGYAWGKDRIYRENREIEKYAATTKISKNPSR